MVLLRNIVLGAGRRVAGHCGNAWQLFTFSVQVGMALVHYLVVPRVLGCMISLFCMIIYFDVVALVGGFLVASTRLTMPFSLYLQFIFDSLAPLDLYLSLSKGLLFGGVIALFSCYHGLRARRAAFEVPMVARSGVIQSMFFVFVSSG